jgi:hypothetical protein
MIIYIDNTVREPATANSGYQPGSATAVAVRPAYSGRNSRISAEQMRSVADNLMEKQQNQRRRGARAVSDQMPSPRVFVMAGLDLA